MHAVERGGGDSFLKPAGDGCPGGSKHKIQCVTPVVDRCNLKPWDNIRLPVICLGKYPDNPSSANCTSAPYNLPVYASPMDKDCNSQLVCVMWCYYSGSQL